MCESNSAIFRSGKKEVDKKETKGDFSESDFKKIDSEIDTNNTKSKEDLLCIPAKSPTKIRGSFF